MAEPELQFTRGASNYKLGRTATKKTLREPYQLQGSYIRLEDASGKYKVMYKEHIDLDFVKRRETMEREAMEQRKFYSSRGTTTVYRSWCDPYLQALQEVASYRSDKCRNCSGSVCMDTASAATSRQSPFLQHLLERTQFHYRFFSGLDAHCESAKHQNFVDNVSGWHT